MIIRLGQRKVFLGSTAHHLTMGTQAQGPLHVHFICSYQIWYSKLT